MKHSAFIEDRTDTHYPHSDVPHAQAAALCGDYRQACAAKGCMGGPSPR